MDAIPRTPHGKADVKAVRAMAVARADRNDLGHAGVSGGEDLAGDPVARLWREVLDGSHSHLFDAGGTSLHAVRLLAGLFEEFGVQVPLGDFIADPTLGRLRAFVAAQDAEAIGLPSPVPRNGPLPLNRYQERLWFLYQLEPGSTAMSAPTAFRIRGASRARVTEAYGTLVTRHEVLRAAFVEADGEPRALIGADPMPLCWSGEGGAVPDEVIRRVVGDLAREPFNLRAGPPLRVCGISFGDYDHLLVLVTHQIIADGWTWSLFAEELAGRLASSQIPPPSVPRLQIADHAAWQREQEATVSHQAAVSKALRYWRATLDGVPDMLDLPTDGPRGDSLSVPAGTVAVPWKTDFPVRLKALCRARRVTEFMVLLAGYTTWLARLSGQETVIVGTPMANRVPSWTNGMAGCFVTTVPQRVDIDEDDTFNDILERARESAIGGQRNSVVPIERIVAEVGGTRSANRLPLFQNLFVFQNMPTWRCGAGDVAVQVHQFPPRHTHYDLKFEVFPHTTGYETRLVYARGRISAERAQLLARQLASLIEAAVEDPCAPVGEIQF